MTAEEWNSLGDLVRVQWANLPPHFQADLIVWTLPEVWAFIMETRLIGLVGGPRLDLWEQRTAEKMFPPKTE